MMHLTDPRAWAVGILAALTTLIGLDVLPHPWDAAAAAIAAGLAGATQWRPNGTTPADDAPQHRAEP